MIDRLVLKEKREVMRPEHKYKRNGERRKDFLNQVTHQWEPKVTLAMKCTTILGTIGVLLFFISLIVFALVGVIVYRAATFGALKTNDKLKMFRPDRVRMIVAFTASLITLVAINLLKFVYKRLALFITDWENPRTQTEYERSFTIKLFCFQ
jgi:anoctamin-4